MASAPTAQHTEPAFAPALARTARANLLALIAAGAAFISPPAALLIIALLAARALLQARTLTRADFSMLVAPVLAAALVAACLGLAAAMGLLFLWRLSADARWAGAEAARLAIAAGHPGETRLSAHIPIWLTAIFAAAMVAYSAPHMLVGLPLDLPRVPLIIPIAAGALAALGIGDWLLRRAADWRLGELAPAPALHLLGFHVLVLAAYGTAFDLSAGFIALVAWRLAHAAPGPLLPNPKSAA